jgi:Macro domain
MRRTKTAFLPSVDVMEPRLLLFAAIPLLSHHGLTVVVREVDAIVKTLAKTEDVVQASTQLTGLASQVPSGSEGLAPAWQNDLGLYRPHSERSVITMQKRIVAQLVRFDQLGFDGGNQPVSGSGSTTPTTPIQGTQGTTAPTPTPDPTPNPTPTPTPTQGGGSTPTPVPTSSLDSVRIQNTTGLAIVVTVQLDVSQTFQPQIRETIPAQASSSALFDFGTATNAFMTMDVSSANGGSQSPTPFNNVMLSQPLGGYNGTLFSISLFGPYFNVTFSWIRDSIRNALKIANEQGFQSIAFPLIGAGSGSFKPERSKAIMLDEFERLEGVFPK